MKLRTRLILAFLALSVLPLGGIVLYSYFASLRAFQEAVHEESSVLADEMNRRLGGVREDLARRIQSLGDLDFGQVEWTADDGSRLAYEIALRMGDAASFVDALELIPEPAPAPAAPPGDAAPVAPTLSASFASRADGEGVVVFLQGIAEVAGDPATWGDGEAVVEGAVAGSLELGSGVIEALAAASPGDAGLAEARRQLEEAAREARKTERVALRVETAGSGRRPAATSDPAELPGRDLPRRVALKRTLTKEELRSLEESRERTKRVLGSDFDCDVAVTGDEVGRLRAKLDSDRLLQVVLGRTRRDQGEIPFAFDPEGRLYTAGADDEESLAALPLTRDAVTREGGVDEGWVVVTSEDPVSGVLLGIARPVRDSMAEIRQTAGRNFGYGLGLIGLALVGIVPLSGRMTREVTELTAGAERLAEGDLTTRVPVRSSDELGRLASTFNRMAGELEEQRRRLVAEERLRREQEVDRTRLEAEDRRKSAELEDARQFQLSLLPRGMPRVAGLELAAHMRTATEVGGDYYDFRVDGELLTVAVGDATGHGLRAGTMVTVLKSLFTDRGGPEPLETFLGRANRTIKRMELGRVTMAMGLARFAGDRLEVALAGMPPVLVHRAATGRVEELMVEALPLGGLAEGEYRRLETRLASGDTVLVLSDGLPELPSPDGDPYGYRRCRDAFAEAAAGTPDEVVARLLAAAESWAGTATPADDMTFVVVRKA